MNERNTIEIEVNLETKDFWRYYFSQYLSFSNILPTFLGYTVFGWFVSLLFLREKLEFLHLVDVVLAAGFFAFFVSFISIYLAVSNTKKIGGQKCKYIVTDEKVEITNDLFKSVVNWTYFYRVKENTKYFVLYMKSGEQHFLPKRFFQEEQITIFKNLVRAKFGEEAYLKKPKENLGLK